MPVGRMQAFSLLLHAKGVKMRKPKRLILLAISAALAIAAVSPAAASASGEWLKNGKPFAGEVEVPYTAVFRNAAGIVNNPAGVICEFHGTATVSGGGSQAQINNIEVTTPYSFKEGPWPDSVCYNPTKECAGVPTVQGLPLSLTLVPPSAEYPDPRWKVGYFIFDTNMAGLIPGGEGCSGLNEQAEVFHGPTPFNLAPTYLEKSGSQRLFSVNPMTDTKILLTKRTYKGVSQSPANMSWELKVSFPELKYIE